MVSTCSKGVIKTKEEGVAPPQTDSFPLCLADSASWSDLNIDSSHLLLSRMSMATAFQAWSAVSLYISRASVEVE